MMLCFDVIHKEVAIEDFLMEIEPLASTNQNPTHER